jgi:hypothetical protein
MNAIAKKIERRLEVIFNQFIEEKVGTSHLNYMPTIDKVPVISKLNYDKDEDAFEVYFKECDDCTLTTKGPVDLLEDKEGHLAAIRIKTFSRLNIDNIKINVLTTIQNEIKELSMEINTKKDIPNNIVDKRKLMFMSNILQHDYKDLKAEFVK